MMLLRAVRLDDLKGLLALATCVEAGMTTFKPDEKALKNRIAIACASFTERLPLEERDYLFVLETSDTKIIVGTCAIKASVGLNDPFYNYRVGTLVHASQELNVYSRMETLQLSNDLTGYAELCSLFLHPSIRGGYAGKLLSRSRFLFMASFPHLFGEKVMAEMRGFQRPDGSSPFWDHLGRHFFKMDFSHADDLVSLGKKEFIAELMPRYPLYIAYLPEEAQRVIGHAHIDSRPALRLLEQEGLYYDGLVDIFDAGPVLQARVAQLKTCQHSQVYTPIYQEKNNVNHEPILVANQSLDDFRVILTSRTLDNHEWALTSVEARQLNIDTDRVINRVRVMPLKR